MAGEHYSMAHFPEHLDVWAKAMAKELIKRFRGTDSYPVLCYRGLSGTASATALMMALSRAKNGIFYTMVYVRKYGEKNSHLSMTESHDNVNADVSPIPTNPVFVVVDDFVHRGETVAELARGFAELYRNRFRRNKFQITNECLMCLTGFSGNYVGRLNDYKKSSYMMPIRIEEKGSHISYFWNREPVNRYLLWATSKGRKHAKCNSYKNWHKRLA